MLNILLNKAELRANSHPLRTPELNKCSVLVKRTEQHSTYRKTKEMLSRPTFVQ